MDPGAERVDAFRSVCAAVRHDLALPPGGERDRAVNERLESAHARLRALSEVRVHVAGAANLGHQASSLRIVERLAHEMRFGGRITVLYEDADDGGETTPSKIALLQPALAAAAERDVRFGEAVVRVLPLARASELANVPFAVSGGSEAVEPAALARALGADVLLMLQPFHWRWARDAVVFARGAPSLLALADDDALGHGFCERAYRVRALGAPSEETRAERLLRHALREARRGGVATAIVYGVRHGGVSRLDPVRVLSAYAETVVASFERAPRRALVVLFGPEPPAFEELARCGGERVRWTVAATHAVLEHDLAWLARENARVLMLYAGHVSEYAFLGALAGAALPSVFEGRATASAALSAGAPFLQLPDGGLDEPPPYPRLPEAPDRFAAAVAACEEAAAAFHRLASGAGGVRERSAVGDFMAAASGGGAVREYVRALCAYYDARGNDKLDVALMTLPALLSPVPVSP